jgi:hypothetical protein
MYQLKSVQKMGEVHFARSFGEPIDPRAHAPTCAGMPWVYGFAL